MQVRVLILSQMITDSIRQDQMEIKMETEILITGMEIPEIHPSVVVIITTEMEITDRMHHIITIRDLSRHRAAELITPMVSREILRMGGIIPGISLEADLHQEIIITNLAGLKGAHCRSFFAEFF